MRSVLEDRDARRVVAAVLEAPQPVERAPAALRARARRSRRFRTCSLLPGSRRSGPDYSDAGPPPGPASCRLLRRAPQPSRFRWRPVDTAMASVGTVFVTVVPAATNAPGSISTGATRFALQPIRAPLADLRAVLALPVVVHGDRAAAEARARPDVGVADVAQVVGLHAVAELAVLHLDEVPDPHAVAEPQSRAGGARSGRSRSRRRSARLDHAVGLEWQRAPIRVAPVMRTPGSIIVSRPISTSASIHAVAGSTNVTPCAIRRSTVRRRSDRGRLGELAAVVHAEALVGVVEPQRLDAAALGDRALDDVRQVELALLVLVVELRERLPEELGVEEVDAGVALLDPELLRGRVGHLDDPLHAARRRRARRGPGAATGAVSRTRSAPVSAFCRAQAPSVSARSSGTSP